MDSVEFRPILFTTSRVLITPFFLFFTFSLYWIVNKFIGSFPLYIASFSIQNSYFIPFVGVFAGWLFLLKLLFLNPLSTKVRIDKNYLVFLNRFLFIGRWREKRIRLNDIVMIEDQEEWHYMGGRLYWLIITLQDGSKEKIWMEEWDKNTLFKMIQQIKESASHIKVRTKVYKDSPEMLAGLVDFQKQQERGQII